MLQTVEQTRDEKIAMYMKLTKRELAEMLANCNEMLANALMQQRQMPANFTVTVRPTQHPDLAPWSPNTCGGGVTWVPPMT